jgi:hypothetical protein
MTLPRLTSLVGFAATSSLLLACGGAQEDASAPAARASELQNADGAYIATSESHQVGIVRSGNYVATQQVDGVSQDIEESPPVYDNTHLLLEHTWTFADVPAGHYTLRVVAKKALLDNEPFGFDWKHATDEYFKYDACVFVSELAFTECLAPITTLGGDVLVRATDQFLRESRANTLSVDFVGLTPRTDTVAPAVAITSPAAGSTVSGTVEVTADASDDVGVARVDFYQGSTLLGSDTTAPFSIAWNTTAVGNASTYTLSARAWDAQGNSTKSATVSNINVLNAGGADIELPRGAITSPATGSAVSGTVTVTASATDNVGVARVEFYHDYTRLIGTDTSAPYSIDWNTQTVTNGSHLVRAVIYDAAGNYINADINVDVFNATTHNAVLTVSATGRAGSISSSPAGLTVYSGGTESATFISGTSVTLTVGGGRSAIWSGACSSAGRKATSCRFTLTGNASVTGNIQ